MTDLWAKARETRDQALRTGRKSDWDIAWAAQSAAERLTMSPVAEHYPKYIEGTPVAGVLPAEESPKTTRRKDGDTMGKDGKKNQGAAPAVEGGKKTRASGIELARKRLAKVIVSLKQLGKTSTKGLTNEQFEATIPCIEKALDEAKATMDKGRAPTEEKKEEELKLPY